jgi:hypothetical protein
MEESGKSPDETPVVGKAAPDADAEVGGRMKQLLYTCFNCGAGNYVDPNSTKPFSCWRCGGYNENSFP